MLYLRLSAVALGLASVVAIQTAQATNGTMSHAYSPASKGMAGAGEAALPQDTLSIVGNPAGLTKLGKRMDIGAAWFSPHRKYSGVNPMRGDGAMAPIGSGDGTGSVESENNDFFVPDFGFSYPLNAKSAIGVGLFGNGGMNTDFRSVDTLGNLGTYGGNNGCANPPHYQNGRPCGPQVPGTSAVGGGNTGVNLTQLGIALGYALDVADNLSLGASFLIGYQQIEIRGVGAFQGYTETFTQSMLANRTASGTIAKRTLGQRGRFLPRLRGPGRRPVGDQPPMDGGHLVALQDVHGQARQVQRPVRGKRWFRHAVGGYCRARL